jgi:integrase
MPNLKYYIDKNKVDSKGFVPIKANIATDSKNNWKTVGKVKPRYWNKKQQRVSTPRPNEEDNDYEDTNSFLDTYQSDAKKYFRDCTLHKIKVTQEVVQNYFNGQKITFNPVKKDLWEAYEEFLKSGELEKAPNTIRNRKTIKNYLKTFESETGYKMTFDSIDLVFFDKLKENVLVTNEHGYNYLSAITDKFKAFMTWSLKRKYHSNTTYKDFSAPEKEGSIVHLTFQELQQLLNHPFENKKLQKARDFYCFGCFTGLRYCDIESLTKDNIIDGMIKTTTQKTNREVVIPLFPGVQTIIERYPDPHKLLPKFSNQKLNDYIKDCCKEAKINTLTESKSFEKNITITEFKPKHELIGTHTARKTFICLAYDRGLDIEMIKSITGITREKTLRRYLQISTDAKKKKLMKAFEGIDNIEKEPTASLPEAIDEAKAGKTVQE